MAQRMEGRMPPWLAFVLGALAAMAAVAVLTVYTGLGPLAARPVALNLNLPRAPSLPDTPRLPPPPIPTPK
ncbi:hypothetical protein [Phenylobacterium sp.]|jgi:hypothetical protein|uniref:hypothetical protein n=1 Tax=Phenylobacterium sp. TaxID=1871053 RepID=UPI002F3F1B04